jgi:hypothetical protein
MKIYPKINYKFRPVSYWIDKDVLQALLRDVKGAARRKMIKACWASGDFDVLDEKLLEPKLSEQEREALGRIHPSFMGGEYLSDLEDGETEIARIDLSSTTFDVISIRARASGGYIQYSVVDEYDTKFNLADEEGYDPFTLSELIDFIDNTDEEGGCYSGLALSSNNSNAEEMSRDELSGFTTITSEIYPELETHYAHVFQEWAAENLYCEEDE